MKKLVLVLAIVFTGSSVVNANSSESESLFRDCAEDAWNFGTDVSFGDEESEYFWTDFYYRVHCSGNWHL